MDFGHWTLLDIIRRVLDLWTSYRVYSGPDCLLSVTYISGMNLLSKFCIAVSATQKLNCVAVGVICVAVFLVCFGKKHNVELRDAFPAQPVQEIKYFEEKKR